MKETNIKAILHVWSLLWVIGLCFILLNPFNASVTILCVLPVNYFIVNMVYKFVNEESKNDKNNNERKIS